MKRALASLLLHTLVCASVAGQASVKALNDVAGPAVVSALVKEDEPSRWRVGIGASLIGPVKSDIGTSGTRMRQLSGFGKSLVQNAAMQSGGQGKSAAFAEGSGAAHGGVRRFDDGAWFDPVDSGTPNDPDYSWNWRLHDPSAEDMASHGKAFVERNAYDETWDTVSIGDGNRFSRWNSDGDDWFPGLRAEVAYELYRSEGDRPWGAELAVAFAYYFQRGLWKASGEAASATVSAHQRKGVWEWWNDSYDEAQYILDYYRDSQLHDGMWGAGSFYGPGAELAVDPWQYRNNGTETSTPLASHSLRYRGDGDYREYSVEFLVRPWWEPWQWLRVFGSIGLELSRREFVWQMSAMGTEGSMFSERDKARDWSVAGLLGGGLSVQWYDFILAGEILWRVGEDELAVSGRTVDGEVKSGNWGLRLSLAHAF